MKINRNFSDDQLHELANRHRPRGVPELSAKDPREVSSLVRTLTEPARRHRCELCTHLFECHLCSIGNTHRLHSAERDQDWSAVLICEVCIREHELWVVMVSAPTSVQGRSHGGDRDLGYYDHLTGDRFQDSKSSLSTRFRTSYQALTYKGQTLSLQQWSDILGIKRATLVYRVKIWGLERALSEPLQTSQSKKARQRHQSKGAA